MALPKDAHGSLDHLGDRFALYRDFLVGHVWHVKGLSMDVEEKGAFSPANVLKSKMPSFIVEVMQQHRGSDRVGLEGLAVLAATIEDSVHSDAVDLLEMAYFSMVSLRGTCWSLTRRIWCCIPSRCTF